MKKRKFRDELALLQMFSFKPSFKLTLKNSQRFILMGASAAWLSRSIDSTSISTSPGMHCLTGVSIPCSITFLLRTQERPSWQLQSPSWAQKRRCERKKKKTKRISAYDLYFKRNSTYRSSYEERAQRRKSVRKAFSVPCVVSPSWRHRFLLSFSLKVQL